MEEVSRMNYESLIIGVSCFLAAFVFIFIVEEWAKSRDGDQLQRVPTLVDNSNDATDKWTRLRLLMDTGRLNSTDPEDKEIIRQIKNEHPDGWFGKCFPDV